MDKENGFQNPSRKNREVNQVSKDRREDMVLAEQSSRNNALNERTVVLHASHSLSDVENRYGQTRKTAIALVWACERFNLHVFGQRFEVETDDKPLGVLLKFLKPLAQIERWVLRASSRMILECN